MEKLLTDKEYNRLTEELNKVKYTCQHCGRRVVIPRFLDKVLCDWCNNYVFKSKKDEDLYRIREKMKK